MSTSPPAVEGSFGLLLRDLRERAGLTQEELAEKAGLTAYAVSALERGRRNRPYPHTVRSLVDALEASDTDRAALLAAIPRRGASDAIVLPDAPPTGAAAPAPPAAPSGSLLTPATRLLGRDTEIADVVDLLVHRDRRLITLTGTGGVGKTSLASAVAAQLAPDFPDGAVLVQLAPLEDPAMVLPALARAVGGSGLQGPDLAQLLADHLRPLRLLLVLDNLERLLDAARPIADLVAACPQLAVLVTSRAPLRVRGEVEYPVQPLSLPGDADVDAAGVAASPAGAVFVERAQAVSPSFELTEANAGAVGAICRRLAGIPLALELAAARSRFLDPQSLLARLDDAMSGGGGRDLPARQQTMAATFDWSYELLSPDEQRLLRTLSVFRGGCTLDAVEGVAGRVAPGDDVLSLLEVLVEHSLVVVRSDPEGRPRYGLLEPVAQYAAGRMSESELAAARDAHAACYLAWAERAAPEYLGGRQVVWLDRSEVEDANLVAAIGWALERGDGDTAGRAGWALWLFWWLRNRLLQGRRLMERALQLELAPLVRVQATLTHACMCFALGDNESAGRGWRQAEELAYAGDDVVSRGQSTAGSGLVALARGDLAAAEDHFVRCLPYFEGQGLYGDWLQSLVHVWLGTVEMLRGDLAAATASCRIGLLSARARGDRLTAYVALFNLSQAAIAQGQHDVARGHLHEGVRLTQETGDVANLAYLLEALAVVEAHDGEPDRVATLVGAAEAAREAVGGQVYGYYKPDEALLARCVAATRERLGDDAFEDAVDAGRSLLPAEAAVYALAGGESAPV